MNIKIFGVVSKLIVGVTSLQNIYYNCVNISN